MAEYSVVNKILVLLRRNEQNQKDLTDYLGIEKSVFSAWISGKSQSYMKYIDKIGHFFNVSLDYLLGENTYQSKSSKSTEYTGKCAEEVKVIRVINSNKGEKVEKTFMATNILELSINGVTITLSVPDGAQVISKSPPKDESPKISLSKIKTEQDSVPNLRDEIPQEVREMLDKKREQYVQKKYGGEYGYFRYQVTKRKKALGINNNMLAEFTGYKQCTISEFMRGHTNSVKVAAAIANVLGAALIFRDGKAILEEVESDVHSN